MSVKKTHKDFVPSYQNHFADNKVYTRDKRSFVTFKVEGLAFESLPDEVIVNLFQAHKDFFVGLCKGGDVYLWLSLVKKQQELTETYHFDNCLFAQRFADVYCERQFSGKALFSTSYFFTVGLPFDTIDEAEESLNEVINQVTTALSEYRISVLGVRDGSVSEIGSDYLNFLYNHTTESLPVLSATPLAQTIRNSQFYFGYDSLEIKNSHEQGNRFCTNYIVKDFPRGTRIGQWNFLLTLPYEFIVTQSFIAESPAKTQKGIDQQLNKMASVGDAGKTQQEELAVGQETVVNQDTLFGSHCCVMTVFGDTPKAAKTNGSKVASEFVTRGRGFRFIKATTEAPFTYFSHLPLSKYRPLASKRTITNVCCLMPFHNHSYGKRTGNPIGDGSALMPLKDTMDGLYFFNTHYSDVGKNVTGQKIAGHALILGATGAGKTTFECAVAAFMQRFDPYLFVIDFNRSTELAVRAFGGSYFSLEEGIYTMLQPFQFGESSDAELMSFLKSWVKRRAVHNDGVPCSDADAQEIDQSVEAVMKLPREERRFSSLQHRIQNADLKMRLSKWWDKGALAWATDSPTNQFNPTDYKKVGFDTTVILEKIGDDTHPACEAILSVLFFFKKRMQRDGQLMLSIVEEFWQPANFPMTQELIKSALKAGRMKGEVMWLTSQSPEDAINCEIFAAIVQQTPTKVLLPNPDGDPAGYKKIGLTDKECKQLFKLKLASRTILIKQSGSSVFAKFDLYGFDDFLPIISGDKAGIKMCERIRHALGTDDPDVWIPLLILALKHRKAVIDEVKSDNPDVWFPVLLQQIMEKSHA